MSQNSGANASNILTVGQFGGLPRIVNHSNYFTTEQKQASFSWLGVAQVGDQIQFYGSETGNGISPTILIRKIEGGTLVEQNNYINPSTNSIGLFNLCTVDDVSRVLWNNTDPDNISITFGDYSVYDPANLLSITYGSNAFFTCVKTCKIRVNFSFVIFNQPNLNYCTVAFRNITTNQNLCQTAIQYLSSLEMGSCYLNGMVDLIAGNLYSFQIDFVGPAPVNISSRNLQIDFQEVIENISQDLVLGSTNVVQWGDGSDGSF